MDLLLVKSGGQNGADLSGIKTAKSFGINVEMLMPKGFRTLNGPKPSYRDLYNAKEHESSNYPPRTYENVKESDGTLRFATDFNSTGEKCTLKAIKQYKKPYFDVKITNTHEYMAKSGQSPDHLIQWLDENKIKILNIAGNSENTSLGIENWIEQYLTKVFTKLKAQNEKK